MDANLSDEIFESVKARFAAADEKSRAIIQEYINGGYKKTLEKLQMYLGGTNRTDPEIICEAGTVLKKSGYYGKTLANDVIENMSDAEYAVYTEHKNEFFEKNPVLALNVEKYAFAFDDIINIDDRSIQKMLREVDCTTVAKALKGENAVADKFFRNMSKRQATMLKEDMEYMEPVKVCDIEKAQHEILDVIKKLEADGEIVISRNQNVLRR